MTLIGIIAGDKSAALKSLGCALCYAFFCQAEVFRVFVEILSGGLTYIRRAHLLMRRIAVVRKHDLQVFGSAGASPSEIAQDFGSY